VLQIVVLRIDAKHVRGPKQVVGILRRNVYDVGKQPDFKELFPGFTNGDPVRGLSMT